MEISALILLLLLILSFAQFILIFVLLEKEQKPIDAAEKRADLVIEETQKKGQGIVYRAMKKAQEIVGEAEVEGIKTAAAAKLRTTQFERDYEEKLGAAVDKSQREIEKIVRDNIAKSMSGFDLKLAEVISKIENERLKEAGVKSDAAKAEIEEYRNTRLARLDDQIAQIVADTVIKTLDKKIDLNSQMQSIYDALERAKAENFVS
ncbi:hypothetical protein A2872_02065 [Candidatus Gottesmanbacteria bacterium RIFCSPHIGHO2_01_FULL_42_12]|uniref:Uncharacterized protein n=1 Tax=Candidatus Gottesmanbacteria bacterium RIFCSPHIGHO2_01_FULL_42_12 TaxID=1798377 RepID=A0A1F5Z6D4_9BACT|nr:MAG: hypothetical protein A2872_02065 [Candidatus Gottesmanbacteria bacterium RIFCSPHIGHO2_01_FULL_42_12]